MKRTIISFVCLCLLALTINSYGQDDRKLRTDQTYSTHNYKHANKAAQARRWEENRGVTVQEPTSEDIRVADYKKSVPNAQPAGGVTVDHTPAASLADRNYKMRREGNQSTVEADRLAKQRKRRSDNSSVIGNE